MAGYGDFASRSQRSVSRNDSPRRLSDFMLPLSRQKSALSVATSLQSEERRTNKQPVGSNYSSPVERPETNNSIRAPSVKPPGKVVAQTLPAWVRRIEEETDLNTSSFPSQPNNARIAQHHYAPLGNQRNVSQFGGQGVAEGHGHPSQSRESRWRTFARSTAYPQSALLEEKVVDHDWLDENFGDYSEPWQGNIDNKDLESAYQSLDINQRRKLWVKRFQRKILQSPMVPLIIRMTVFFFACIALALGGTIRHNATQLNRPQGPSADMAIIVDAIALVYLVYITWDEYTGKPLGLRPAKAKIRLIFLDLIFIVFASANLSLAFESLSTLSGSCTSAEINREIDPKNDTICEKQKALASVLLIVLIAWIMTFAISVLRVVERVSGQQ